MVSLSRLVLTNNTQVCGPLPSGWSGSKVTSTNTSVGGTSCPLAPQTAALMALRNAITDASWPGQ
jgi:hypothetical protein